MLIKPDIARFAKIKVVGIGGGGCNAGSPMISSTQITGVDFIGVNTDAQALLTCQAPVKIQIGDDLAKGLGAGGDPEIGRQAAEESKEKIREALVDSDMVFLTCGEGGGTGTGATPIIAEIAHEANTLTVAVVTKPFSFEGTRRMLAAEEGILNLKDKVDTLIVIPNQRILDVVDKKMTLVDAFKIVDSVLGQGVTGGSDLTMTEVDEAAKLIAAAVDNDANIIFGATIDEQMVDQVKITVIATGFDETKRRLQELSLKSEPIVEGTDSSESASTPAPSNNGEEDEWDIPAFLRQGK